MTIEAHVNACDQVQRYPREPRRGARTLGVFAASWSVGALMKIGWLGGLIVVAGVACSQPAAQRSPRAEFRTADFSAAPRTQPAEPLPLPISAYTEEVRGGRSYRIYSDGRIMVYLDGGQVDSLYGPRGWMAAEEYEKRLALRAKLDCMRQRAAEIALYGHPMTVCAV